MADKGHIIRSPLNVEVENIDRYSGYKKAFDKFPLQKAIIDTSNGSFITYTELGEKAERLASRLYYEYKIRKNDRAAIFSGNSIDFQVVSVALCRIAAIPVLINCLTTAAELPQYLTTAPVRVIFADVERVAAALLVAKVAGIQVIVIDGDANDTVTLTSLISDVTFKPLPHVTSCNIDPSRDTAVVYFSSGTTGLPKGVMTSHTNL